MINTRAGICIVAVVGAALLLAVGYSSGSIAEAQSRGNNLTGTWFVSVQDGTKAFYSYHQDGTMTGVASTIHGGPPRPGVLNSTDHGVWRQIGGGFEAIVFRMGYNMATPGMIGNVEQITRIRTVFGLDRGGESTSGTFFVAIWVCPTPTTCPDPNVDPPNVPEFTPPGNTFTQTRVRLQ